AGQTADIDGDARRLQGEARVHNRGNLHVDADGGGHRGGAGIVGHDVLEAIRAAEAGERGVGERVRGGGGGDGTMHRTGGLGHAAGIKDVVVAVRVRVVFEHGDRDGLGAVGNGEVVDGDGAIDADKDRGGQRRGAGVVRDDVTEAVRAGEGAEGGVGEGIGGGVERDRAVCRTGEQRHAAGGLDVLVAVPLAVLAATPHHAPPC